MLDVAESGREWNRELKEVSKLAEGNKTLQVSSRTDCISQSNHGGRAGAGSSCLQ